MSTFSIQCKQCPRLAGFLKQVKRDNPDYYAAPVPPYGDDKARLLIVGLAPGMHGANRTGRPFTGDHAGILLYKTLYDFGFANKPESVALGDGFELINCRITNAVKCLPPENKPNTDEIAQCNDYLTQEIATFPRGGVILALGNIAHGAVLRATGQKVGQYKFQHEALYELPSQHYLLDSYHCSRYNTQTRRLTEPMFRQVFQRASDLLAR